MSIKVVPYERQINRVTPSISAPQELRPPPGAFGTDVAEATTKLGETGMKIASLIIQRAQERQKELMVRDNLNKDTAFGQTMMDVQYNNELDDSGKPKGLLNRKLEQVHGITQEFNQTYYTMRKQLLDGVKDPEQQDALAKMLDSRFESIQSRVANHERQQTDESIKVAHESSQVLQENDAAQLRDTPSLINAIGKAVVFNDDYNRFMGYDENTAQVKNGEVATKIVKSAVLATFNTNGLLPAQRLLNDVQDRIPKSAFDDLSKQIEIDAKQTTERARFQAMVAQDQTESGLIDKYFKGELTRDEVKQLHFNKKISDGFATTMMNNLNSLQKIGAKTKASTFNDIAEMMVDTTKKPADIRMKLLQKNATGELTDNDFQVLYTFNQSVTKDTVDKSLPKRTWLQRLFNNGKDTGLRQEVITDMFKQYMQRVNTGEDPARAVSEIISTHLDNHLAEEAKKPNRQYAVNPATKQKIYSEDGGLTWYDEKTNKPIK
ncbi:MAG: hypothetical protein PHG87_01495 [Candidatus Omnitrophica bacterium]|nr:hypothetical protein [Candidatus Omnitrophota bacterium]